MILKNITLRNIRSYKDQTRIEIPIGRTLFQGDIGCGKSTILSAIEFALFGLGDVDGSYLLRSGEKGGFVLLEFEIKGRSYKIYRSLLRQDVNSVIQKEGYIIDGDVKTSYSVGEMKSRVLEIINIKEKPQTNATSLIYRYAIFTPQEMMKQILTEKKDRRLEILRRAFGIDEYRIAKNNSDLTSKWIMDEIRISNEISKDLQDKSIVLKERNKKADALSRDIVEVRNRISELDRILKEKQKPLNELKKKKDLVIKLQTSIPYLKESISEIKKHTELERQTIKKLEADMSKIRKSEEIVNILRHKYNDYREKKASLSLMKTSIKRYESLDREKTRLEQSIENERKHLESEKAAKRKEIEDEQQWIKKEKDSIVDLPLLENSEANLNHRLNQLPSLRKESANIQLRISKYDEKIIFKKQVITDGQKEIKEICSIGEGAKCPKCRQKLTKEHISKVKDEFENEKMKSEEQIDSIRRQISNEEEGRKKIDDNILMLERKEDELKKLQRRLGKLTEKRDAIVIAFKKLKGKKAKLNTITELLQKEEYSLEERKKLDLLLVDLNALINDKTRYEEMHELISKYEVEEVEVHYIENFQEVKRKSTVESGLAKAKSTIAGLMNDIRSGEGKLRNEQKLYDENKDSIQSLDSLQSEIQDLQNKISNKKQILAANLSESDSMQSTLKELRHEIMKKEEHYRNKQVFQQTQNWIDQCFVPAIEDIEKYVLENIQEEFNQYFQRWFNILMETGDISVEVDESFTPIITQNGYSLGIDSLSGGEKTSAALAYRLALNTIIKKAADMENNLIILDEPTDGFGKEQLIRLRRVLDELEFAQIIMVSHERELESFVDTIYRISKEGGISRIEPVTLYQVV